ncbi:MAG: leucine-rich repeat domain-containing protein [Bryobacterales bacterium]|nr:leucine-rich repeat domain-containing protein [Bryobacterales bacterium]
MELTELPPSLFACESLEFLSVSNNALTSLPEQMAALQNLRELWLFDNQLSSVPGVLAGLPALRTLWVYQNRIEAWPEIPHAWASLEELDIAANRLREVPGHLAALPRLKRLVVTSNPVQSVSAELSSRRGLTIFVGPPQVNVLPPALLESYRSNVPPSQEEVWEYRFRRALQAGDSTPVLDIHNRSPRWLDALGHVENLRVRKTGMDAFDLPDLPRLRTFAIEVGSVTNDCGRHAICVPASLERSSELEALCLNPVLPVRIPAFVARLPRLSSLVLLNCGFGHQQQMFEFEPLPPDSGNRPFAVLKSLTVSNGAVPELMGQCGGLEVLSLQSNGMRPAALGELIGGNPLLRDVTLAANDLEELPESIAGLRHLEILALWGNRLTSLPAWVGGLPALKYLYLGDNPVDTLPSLRQLRLETLQARGSQALSQAIRGMDGIPTLCVSGGDWNPERLPKVERLALLQARCTGGVAPAGLKALDLEDWGSDSLPDWVRDCADLEVLSLKSPTLRRLPAWIGELGKLKDLSVSAGELTALPDETGGLENLETLTVLGSLAALPETIGKLRNLKTLILSQNKLRQIPTSLQDLRSLKKLELGGNDLQNGLRQLPPLPDLEHLGIASNGLRHLPANLRGFRHLRHLDLSDNKVPFATDCLAQLTELRWLNLAGCGLDQLPAGIERLTALETLDVSRNHLEHLPQGFGDLQELKVANLGENRLRDVAVPLSRLQKLESIVLSGNGIQSLSLALYAISDLVDLSPGFAVIPPDRDVANVRLAHPGMSSPFVASH